jgi:hypothetical protein
MNRISRISRISRITIVPTFLLLAASSLLAPSAHASSKQSPPPSVASIEVAATANAFATSAGTFAPGWTKVTLKNGDKQPHQASLVRLADGTSSSAFVSQFGEQGERALAGTVSSGGPAIAFPGASSTVMVNLSPGIYIAADLVPGSDGKLKATKGYMTSFTVKSSPDTRPVRRPIAKATVELHDFFFAGGAKLQQGSTIAIRNGGNQPHELVMFSLAPTKTAKDVADYLMNPAPAGPPPFTAAAGMAGIAPKGVGYVTVDLPPGRVAFLCFLPDLAGKGEPHFTKGMIAEGEVIA